MPSAPLPDLNKCSNILVATLIGLPYQTTGSNPLMMVKSVLNIRTEQTMTVPAHEFIRRFLLHVLPHNFMKIRYFGFLSHRNKKQAVALIRKLIDPNGFLPEKLKKTVLEMMLRLTGQDILCCPNCKKGKMTIIKKLPNQFLNSS